ncbi:MAG: YaiO family outer membrane beta-barrel protein [Burkholderiaceae bacterium]
MKSHTIPTACALALTLAASAVPAQTLLRGQEFQLPAAPPVPAPAGEGRRSFELSAEHQNLSNGYGDWNGITARGTWALPGHLVQGEASVMRRFGEKGVFLGVSDTHDFNEDWFGILSAGAGDGAFFLPRFRVDGAIYRKWLTDRRLVTSIGLGYYRAPDRHTDRSVSLGAAYYFTAPWILEGGVRFNDSDPGSVGTSQRFVAATWGRSGQDLVTGRHAWGGEGYLAVGPATQMVNFRSRESAVSWRHWLTPGSGFLVGANRYTNPLYRRTGVTVGYFQDF